MTPFRSALRQSPLVYRSFAPTRSVFRHQPVRYASSSRGRGGRKWTAGVVLAFAGGWLAMAAYPIYFQGPKKRPETMINYEKTRPVAESREDHRDLISSQHLQVKKSWENPGVYAWGSNEGRVAAPDSNEKVIKTPRRIPYFDGQLLRDIKLDREFGAALTENGDLVQWGTAYSKEDPKPTTTLKGKDLVKLAISRDRILALGKNGTVYSIPVSGSDQAASSSTDSSSWFGLWSSPSTVSYRKLDIPSLGWGESVKDISSGLEHALLLTDRGRVFSAASSTTDFPFKGQLGIPGLTWATRPKGPYDQPHEILDLKGFNVKKIAAGDFHSLALDKDGCVFVFGDNTSGQLGFETEHETPFVYTPIPLPFSKIYSGTGRQPRVTDIAAGGANSFFAVDATHIAAPTGNDNNKQVIPTKDGLGRITADVWACGSGIFGSLGNGRWSHVTLGPSKIKPLSGLYEWDEKSKSVIPIRIARLSVGSTHSAAVMNNLTKIDTSKSSSDNDTNWGADIVFWGGNEQYQLGTGRRNNVSSPTYIEPLDGGKADAEKGRAGEEHRFQITPRASVKIVDQYGKGRKVSVEQRVECGRFVTAVYSAT